MQDFDILGDAAKVLGQRGGEYGSAVESFTNIAALWSVVLGTPVSAQQVALCMIQLKTVRLLENPDHYDSWLDIIGYAALGEGLGADW